MHGAVNEFVVIKLWLLKRETAEIIVLKFTIFKVMLSLFSWISTMDTLLILLILYFNHIVIKRTRSFHL